MAFLGKLTSFPLSGCNPENEFENIFCFLVCMENHYFFLVISNGYMDQNFCSQHESFWVWHCGSFGFKGGKWKCFPPKTNCFPLTRLDHSFLQFKIRENLTNVF